MVESGTSAIAGVGVVGVPSCAFSQVTEGRELSSRSFLPPLLLLYAGLDVTAQVKLSAECTALGLQSKEEDMRQRSTVVRDLCKASCNLRRAREGLTT